MHAVNQPVATANASLDRLQTLINKQDDAQLRTDLQELHDRTAAQLSTVGAAVTRILEVVDFDPEPATFNVEDVVDEAVTRTEAPDRKIERKIPKGLQVTIAPDPVREALVELLSNAAYAATKADRPPRITIEGSHKDGHVLIDVDDNGGGIAEQVKPDLFKQAASTSGGIGMGLILVRQLLRFVGGDVTLVRTDSAGSTFRIRVPEAGK